MSSGHPACLAGWILLRGLHFLLLRSFRIFEIFTGTSWALFLLILFWLSGRHLIKIVLMESGLLRSCQRAGGPVSWGLQAFVGRGTLQIRQGRLGGRAAGGSGTSKLKRVSRGMRLTCRQLSIFVNYTFAPALLVRRRIKSVADVLKGIRQNGFSE